MEKIVYILGAGFSAPLGLPVISNFWKKSSKIARSNPADFGFFEDIIKKLGSTSAASDYFDYSRFNIEEAMSILEVSGNLGKGTSLEALQKYIVNVIVASTPEIGEQDISTLPNDWRDKVFGVDDRWQWYGHFVASLFHLKLIPRPYEDPYRQIKHELWMHDFKGAESYAIITLNYDMVLEKICDFLNSYCHKGSKPGIHFASSLKESSELQRPILCKIHGSVDGGTIVPPTYLKGLYHDSIPESWKLAYEVLSQAHQIRILGYSLPLSDSYVKYILKAAVVTGRQLESVDVVCRDSSGEVEKRYRDFIRFNLTFRKASIEDYLGKVFQLRTINTDAEEITFDKLERAHGDFIGR